MKKISLAGPVLDSFVCLFVFLFLLSYIKIHILIQYIKSLYIIHGCPMYDILQKLTTQKGGKIKTKNTWTLIGLCLWLPITLCKS